MDDDLPTDFQVIVVGTGMVESIVAAACSRIGKNVLHLDSSDHYGGLWASYNFDGLQKFIKEVNSDPKRQLQVYNLAEKWYIEKESAQDEKKEEGEEKPEDPKPEPGKKVWSQANFASEYRKFNIDMTPKLLFSRGPLVELLISSNIARYAEFRCVTRVLTWLSDKLMPVPCSRADVFATEAVGIVEKRQLMKMLTSIVGYNEEEMNNEFKGMVESIVAAACSRIGKNVLHLDSSDHYGGLWASYNFDGLQKFIKEVNSDPKRQLQVYNLAEKWYIEKESAQDEKKEEGEEKPEDPKPEPGKKVWSQANFASEYRKFNIDMTPKLLFSRGPLVELLISSNIARYAEFRCVTRVLTWLSDKLMPVPCSRADVFATEAVGIVEKRQLMKMLTSIVGYNEEEMNNEFKDWNDKTFKEYLAHKGLTPNLIHYVLYAIAGGTNTMPCLEGVKECKKFLMSLGRYGNTPFLWPMYGSGELPQCFCRLCAVFGGVYCLNRPIDKVQTKTVDEGRTVVTIDSKSKTLNCDHLVIGINECPKDLISPEPAESSDISKAVFITNGSIMKSDKEPLTLLRFPPLNDGDHSVTVLEVGPATGSCPKGLFVVYFITNKVKDAESDLMGIAEKIFDMSGGDQTEEADKPKCLWSLFYNVKDTSAPVTSVVDSVHVCSGPDAGLDFDRAVEQAEQIFKKICPGEEFLPRAPDPEEIVFEDDVTHGPEFTREHDEDEAPKE